MGGLIITDLTYQCLLQDRKLTCYPKIPNIGRQYMFSVMQHKLGALQTRLETK